MNHADMRGGRWFWLYAALVVAVAFVVIVVLGVAWWSGIVYALFQVEVAFRVTEWLRRRRLRPNHRSSQAKS